MPLRAADTPLAARADATIRRVYISRYFLRDADALLA